MFIVIALTLDLSKCTKVENWFPSFYDTSFSGSFVMLMKSYKRLELSNFRTGTHSTAMRLANNSIFIHSVELSCGFWFVENHCNFKCT